MVIGKRLERPRLEFWELTELRLVSHFFGPQYAILQNGLKLLPRDAIMIPKDYPCQRDRAMSSIYRNMLWVKVKWSEVKSLSHVRLFATPWTVAHQASPSMGFSRQEYWSGLPFPSPGDLPDPGIEPRSPALQADALTSEPPGLKDLLK